jgi:hypothetical protein
VSTISLHLMGIWRVASMFRFRLVLPLCSSRFLQHVFSHLSAEGGRLPLCLGSDGCFLYTRVGVFKLGFLTNFLSHSVSIKWEGYSYVPGSRVQNPMMGCKANFMVISASSLQQSACSTSASTF